jgi:hypothetical protein
MNSVSTHRSRITILSISLAGSGLLVAGLLGVVIGLASGRRAVAQEPARTEVKAAVKWEYKAVKLDRGLNEDYDKKLNEAAVDGWELHSSHPNVAIYRRTKS